MRRAALWIAFTGMVMLAGPALAQQKLVVSVWGGTWRDMVADTISKRFTAETGVQVEYVTGGTVDRLNKAKLFKGDPESDLVLTTGHVGWLYASDGLFERLDLSRIPNAKDVFEEAKISPYHIGLWSYVYTIGYRPDLVPADITFTSWRDLWNPKLKGMIGLPDFDPSHIMVVAAKLSGGDEKLWQKGQPLLLELKPNIKAFYASDATSQEKIANGETPVQVILSGNALHNIDQGINLKIVVPKEGAVVGFDTIAINKGSRKIELAYKFIDIALDPVAQLGAVKFKKLGPMNAKTSVPPELSNLPGLFTNARQLKESIVIDDKLRSELFNEWKKWFTENLIAG